MGNICSSTGRTEIRNSEKPWALKAFGVEFLNASGQIFDDFSEAIVYAAQDQISFSTGPGSLLLQKAGHGIQDEVRKILEQKGEIKPGDVIVTSGGLLKSVKYVFHGISPGWTGGDSPNDISAMESLVKNSLVEADKLQVISIAYSPLTSGPYGFPKEKAVEIFVDQLLAYFKDNTGSTIKIVKFVAQDNLLNKQYKEKLSEKTGTKETPKDDRKQSSPTNLGPDTQTNQPTEVVTEKVIIQNGETQKDEERAGGAIEIHKEKTKEEHFKAAAFGANHISNPNKEEHKETDQQAQESGSQVVISGSDSKDGQNGDASKVEKVEEIKVVEKVENGNVEKTEHHEQPVVAIQEVIHEEPKKEEPVIHQQVHQEPEKEEPAHQEQHHEEQKKEELVQQEQHHEEPKKEESVHQEQHHEEHHEEPKKEESVHQEPNHEEQPHEEPKKDEVAEHHEEPNNADQEHHD